jgi:hypothetical protein
VRLCYGEYVASVTGNRRMYGTVFMTTGSFILADSENKEIRSDHVSGLKHLEKSIRIRDKGDRPLRHVDPFDNASQQGFGNMIEN